MARNLLEGVDIAEAKKSSGTNLLPDYKPNFSQLMKGFGDNPPPLPASHGFEKIKEDVRGSIGDIPGATMGALGFMKDLAMESALPWINPAQAVGSLIDFAGQSSEEKQQGLLNKPKVALSGFAKGGNILGNILPEIRDYAVETFPDKYYPNLGAEGLPSFKIPGMPGKEHDYLADTGGELRNKSDELVFESFKRLPLVATSGGNPFLLEAERATGEGESPITAAGTAATLGLGAKGIGAAGKAAAPYVEKFREKIETAKAIKSPVEMAKKIAVDDLDMHLNTASKGYESVFDKADTAGVTKSQIKKAPAPSFFKSIPEDLRKPVSKAFRTQNLRDIHEGIKSINEYLEGHKADLKKGYVPPEAKTAAAQAKKVRNNFRNALDSGLEKAGGQELVSEFKGWNDYWKNNVVDSLYNKKIQAFRDKVKSGKDINLEKVSEDFINKIAKDEKFVAYMSKQYPEVYAYLKQQKGLGKFKSIIENSIGLGIFGKLLGMVGI